MPPPKTIFAFKQRIADVECLDLSWIYSLSSPYGTSLPHDNSSNLQDSLEALGYCGYTPDMPIDIVLHSGRPIYPSPPISPSYFPVSSFHPRAAPASFPRHQAHPVHPVADILASLQPGPSNRRPAGSTQIPNQEEGQRNRNTRRSTVPSVSILHKSSQPICV